MGNQELQVLAPAPTFSKARWTHILGTPQHHPAQFHLRASPLQPLCLKQPSHRMVAWFHPPVLQRGCPTPPPKTPLLLLSLLLSWLIFLQSNDHILLLQYRMYLLSVSCTTVETKAGTLFCIQGYPQGLEQSLAHRNTLGKVPPRASHVSSMKWGWRWDS